MLYRPKIGLRLGDTAVRRREDELRERIVEDLAHSHSDLGIAVTGKIGTGLSCLVLGGFSPRLGAVAIRVPWSPRLANDNDLRVDAGRQLDQEAALYEHLRKSGLPAPTVFSITSSDHEPVYMIASAVDHDRKGPGPAELGRVLRRNSRIGTPGLSVAGDDGAQPFRNVVRADSSSLIRREPARQGPDRPRGTACTLSCITGCGHGSTASPHGLSPSQRTISRRTRRCGT